MIPDPYINNFKPGISVVCIDDSWPEVAIKNPKYWLKKGRIYTVDKVLPDRNGISLCQIDESKLVLLSLYDYNGFKVTRFIPLDMLREICQSIPKGMLYDR
jgi:hypothetical protein